jgi:hypothetical protein
VGARPQSGRLLSVLRAREAGAYRLAEESVLISDDSRNDYMEKRLKSGEITVVLDHENVARSKLRVDTRKWFASKFAKQLADRPPPEPESAKKKEFIPVINITVGKQLERQRGDIKTIDATEGEPAPETIDSPEFDSD